MTALPVTGSVYAATGKDSLMAAGEKVLVLGPALDRDQWPCARFSPDGNCFYSGPVCGVESCIASGALAHEADLTPEEVGVWEVMAS